MTTKARSAPAVGRPRDAEIDKAVLEATRHHLAVHGLSGLSFAAIAEEAGTTRPALYRRWPTKLALAVAAVIDLAEIDPPATSEEPFEDAELWVLPNPSGLNAHETVDSLADWYRRAAVAAGVDPR